MESARLCLRFACLLMALHCKSLLGEGMGICLQVVLSLSSHAQLSSVCSCRAGHLHLLALNSEVDMAPGSAQWNFAAADLAAVDRARTPFVVVQWHRLMYSAAPVSNSDYTWGDTVGGVGACLCCEVWCGCGAYCSRVCGESR